MSKFNLQQPDWTFNPKASEELPEFHANSRKKDKLTTDELEAEASRQTGDMTMYVYYARSVGWFPVLVFVVAIVGFVFCYSFPSKWFRII